MLECAGNLGLCRRDGLQRVLALDEWVVLKNCLKKTSGFSVGEVRRYGNDLKSAFGPKWHRHRKGNKNGQCTYVTSGYTVEYRSSTVARG